MGKMKKFYDQNGNLYVSSLGDTGSESESDLSSDSEVETRKATKTKKRSHGSSGSSKNEKSLSSKKSKKTSKSSKRDLSDSEEDSDDDLDVDEDTLQQEADEKERQAYEKAKLYVKKYEKKIKEEKAQKQAKWKKAHYLLRDAAKAKNNIDNWSKMEPVLDKKTGTMVDPAFKKGIPKSRQNGMQKFADARKIIAGLNEIDNAKGRKYSPNWDIENFDDLKTGKEDKKQKKKEAFKNTMHAMGLNLDSKQVEEFWIKMKETNSETKLGDINRDEEMIKSADKPLVEKAPLQEPAIMAIPKETESVPVQE
jgi:hypothetical protein